MDKTNGSVEAATSSFVSIVPQYMAMPCMSSPFVLEFSRSAIAPIRAWHQSNQQNIQIILKQPVKQRAYKLLASRSRFSYKQGEVIHQTG
jgi:hypothetical protein